MKKRLPQTSLEARNSTKKTLPSLHRQIIIDALESIKKGNFEQISTSCGLTPHQVARRLKECEGDKLNNLPALLVRLEEKMPTSSGRMAYVYQSIKQIHNDQQ